MSHPRESMAAMTFDPLNRRRPSHDLFELQQQIITELTSLWKRGWMPADVLAVVSFSRSNRVALLAARMILAEHLVEEYHDRLAPRWKQQLNTMPVTIHSPSPLSDLINTRNADSVMADATSLHQALAWLPDLRQICDPPGTATLGAIRSEPTSGPASDRTLKRPATTDPGMLRRVRALLAKAEATEFQAEAEAFTAKAQNLITTHSLQHLLDSLHNDSASGESPSTVRLAVERPYEREKFGLLAEVARANRCRAVLHTGLGLATVMGFDLDIEAVELIYTSLLVQATHAMQSHGSQTNGWGGNSTRTFRRSFLFGFTGRIGERLSSAAESAATQAATATSKSGHERLLPVLASREAEVDAFVDESFPHLSSLRSRARIDGSGYSAGVKAANRADLGARRSLAS